MNKKIFGRAAALGLAGLTTMSTIAIVASADAFPTNIYEFTYKGIASTARSAQANAAMADNVYVSAAADEVFSVGFKVADLTLFDIDATYLPSYMSTLNFSTGEWLYTEAAAFTGIPTAVKPTDYIVSRADGSPITDETFYFKSAAERDAAKSTIASQNQSEYSNKYNKAYSALKSDLTKIASAHKTEATKNLNALKKENSENMTPEAYKIWLADDISGYKALNNQISSDYTARTKAITVVMKEFEEAYGPKNRGFGHTEKPGSAGASYAVFLVDDSSTDVIIHGVAGNTYFEATYDGLGDLTLCKYRTQTSYVDADSYAFKGEILKAATLKGGTLDESVAANNAYLVKGDLWQQFSSSFEGGATNNENTSEGGTKDDKKEEETTKTPDQTAVYKVGSYYYPTYSAAFNAANGNEDIITKIRDYAVLPYDYFSQVTGSFYSKYADALKASNNEASKVTVFNNASTSTGNENSLDPYYYYWLAKQQGGTTVKDTTSATLGKRTGWTSIANYLSGVSNGTSATVDMNKETTVPSSVLGAIEGKNVTVKFVQDNGASLTVNGKDVANAKNVEIDVTYNTKSISKKLIQNAFKKNGAVSSAQISIDEGSFGFESDLTVKFNSKRAGYSAKIYRYNSSRNSLQLVDTATVSNSGKTTFDGITKGGEFVIVLFED